MDKKQIIAGAITLVLLISAMATTAIPANKSNIKGLDNVIDAGARRSVTSSSSYMESSPQRPSKCRHGSFY